MKKIRLEKEDVVNLSGLTVANHIGFITEGNLKGYLVYVGDDSGNRVKISAVENSNEGDENVVCNRSFGRFIVNSYYWEQGNPFAFRQGEELPRIPSLVNNFC